MPLDFDYRYVALWEPGDPPPDLFAFLTQCGDLNPAQQLAVLLADQPRRWQTEQALTVEDYLARLPDLAERPRRQAATGDRGIPARQSSRHVPRASTSSPPAFADISDALRGKLSERLSSDNAKERRKFTTTQTYISDSIVGDRADWKIPTDSSVGRRSVWSCLSGIRRRTPTASRHQSPHRRAIPEARRCRSLSCRSSHRRQFGSSAHRARA